MIKVLQFLENENYYWSNLKPENILFDKINNKIKINEYGLIN